MRRKVVYLFALFSVLLWLLNTSLFVAKPTNGGVKLLAHRGVHQIYAGGKPDNSTCTANPIEAPTHAYLENTIGSMQAAFDAGADVVELDVHLTPDAQFAVFHDWRLECRTDGHGVTEETPMTVLKSLDIGYGYSSDGGQTFPFRGKGFGLMPTLVDVFKALPEKHFLVNFKSRREDEGEAFAALLNAIPAWRAQVFGVYGHEAPTRKVLAQVPGMRGYDKRSLLACYWRYVILGWTGWVPSPCRNTLIVVPINYAPWLWGWPTRFQQRMTDNSSDVILIGAYDGEGFTSGIDSVAAAADVPDRFSGYLWTNRIEKIDSILND